MPPAIRRSSGRRRQRNGSRRNPGCRRQARRSTRPAPAASETRCGHEAQHAAGVLPGGAQHALRVVWLERHGVVLVAGRSKESTGAGLLRPGADHAAGLERRRVLRGVREASRVDSVLRSAPTPISTSGTRRSGSSKRFPRANARSSRSPTRPSPPASGRTSSSPSSASTPASRTASRACISTASRVGARCPATDFHLGPAAGVRRPRPQQYRALTTVDLQPRARARRSRCGVPPGIRGVRAGSVSDCDRQQPRPFVSKVIN